MTTPRFSINDAARRKRPGAIPHQLACCLTLLLAWGCSDDEGSVTPIVDAGPDAAADADAPVDTTESPESSNSTKATSTSPESTSVANDSLTADVGHTSDAPQDTSSTASTTGGDVDTTLEPNLTSAPDAPDSGVPQTTHSAPDSGVDETTGPQLPAHCANLPAAPVAFEEIPGFTSSEDFVFDELGNYVGIDDNNNLVRISKDGAKSLWLPAMGSTAGMGILPDGSVVICDVGAGSLKRVYPDGTLTTIVAGLEYPNGLDIGPDGYIYVAENNADRVRRVNPDTGHFTFVAIGLEGANGVAFSNDPSLMYVGSFEGSGVYRVEISVPGELGVASVLSRPNGSQLPEPRLACPDQQVGVECDLGWGYKGTCQAIANVVDCFRADPCVGEENGTSCDFPEQGLCKDEVCTPSCSGLAAWDACVIPFNDSVPGVCAPKSDGSLACREPSPCDGHPAGDACTLDGEVGVCAESYPGSDVYCRLPQPCDGLEEGDVCVIEGGEEGEQGICQPQQYYYGPYTPDTGLFCGPPPPCDGKEEGDDCTTNGEMPGRCEESWNGLQCEMIPPCEGKTEGDECIAYQGIPGVCIDYGYGDEPYLYCDVVNPCEDVELGTECVDPVTQVPGTCEETYWGSVTCTPPNPCEGLELNAACSLDAETTGRCMDAFEDGNLLCWQDQCAEAESGDGCSASYFSNGVCTQSESGLVCDRVGPCDGQDVGNSCLIPKQWEYGTCAEGDGGLYCRELGPCEGQAAGDVCFTDSGTGQCVTGGDDLVCQLPCDGREVGDACQTAEGTGKCVESWYSDDLQCDLPEPCEGANEGDACTAGFGTGTCTWVTGYNYYYPGVPTPPVPTVSPGPAITPVPVNFSANALSVGGDGGMTSNVYTDAGVAAPVGDVDGSVVAYDAGPVTYVDAGQWNPEPVLACRPSADCTGKPDGEACSLESGEIGQCLQQQCREQSFPGGIDGLGVDACGYVYASEYVNGNVWRIAPDGTTELIAVLPSSWIPNIKWGRGIGGFESDVMYIADRNQGRLFGMSVGGPGVTEYYDLVNAQP